MAGALKGLPQVMDNLNREITGIKRRSRQGLIAAGLVIKADSIRNAPVDTSNLRQSHFVYWQGGSVQAAPNEPGGDFARLRISHDATMAEAIAQIGRFSVRIGATAHYAIFVHEGAQGRTPSKFLERAVRANREEILRLIRERGQIG